MEFLVYSLGHISDRYSQFRTVEARPKTLSIAMCLMPARVSLVSYGLPVIKVLQRFEGLEQPFAIPVFHI